MLTSKSQEIAKLETGEARVDIIVKEFEKIIDASLKFLYLYDVSNYPEFNMKPMQ